MFPQVEILTGTARMALEKDGVAIVPAGNLTLIISDSPSSAVFLNGRPRHAQEIGGNLVLFVDSSRSVGFHHLHIPPDHDYWFGTDDAKLRLEGVEAMLRYLRNEGLGWTGQLLFSDGSYLRDVHVVYGWLDHHADRILSAAEQIAQFPHRGIVRHSQILPRGGRNVALGRTMAMLRRRGAELLEESANGTVFFGDKRYFPRKVVARVLTGSLDTLANRRVVWLVATVAKLLAEVLPELKSTSEADRCKSWLKRARKLLTVSCLSFLYPEALRERPQPARTAQEIVDSRYATVYEAARALSEGFGWIAQRQRQLLYSYVEYVDEIYQSFVAYAVADALGLRPRAATLRLAQPSFVSDAWEMYYDVSPPDHVLLSWRSFTDTPDDLRPDFLLRDLPGGRVTLADAKYRNNGARASEPSRKDILVYMASFGLEKGMIFFPPAPSDALGVYVVGAHGYELVEVTVSPVAGLRAFLTEKLRGAVVRASCNPRWRR